MVFLADDSELWYSFGLNRPADPNTPEVPETPTLVAGAAGSFTANWPSARRADHYRVWKQVVGVDADFVFLDNPHDPTETVTGYTSGKTVKICVSAVNDAGETSKSEPAELVVP
jgi:hypothetical protein